MTFKGLLPLALLSLALGCRFERLQQARVAQEIKALEREMTSGKPLAPLTVDPSRLGPYFPLLQHMHAQATRLQTASQQVEILGKADGESLRPQRLVDADHRRKEHERLGALVHHLETALDAEDELVGPKGQAFVTALPVDAEFKQGVANGYREKGKTLDLLIGIMRQKREYYRQMEGIVTLADQGLEGLEAGGKLRFRTHEQVMAYLNAVTELLKAERLLNEDVARFQAQRQTGSAVAGS
ncbi:MAG TPA: hypothetical protein VJ623_00030 [Holophagaceae bacterium]|nr:hypothetical protein [Holophagaceae bacterium]